MQDENVITPQATEENSQQEEVQLETNGTQSVEDSYSQEKPATVGLDKYLSEKNARKAAEAKIAELESYRPSMTEKQYDSEIDKLSDKYNLDKDFLTELTQGLKNDFDQKLKPFEAEKENNRIEAVFSKNYAQAIENVPEYKDIVNPSVIKQLSLLKDSNGRLVNGHKNLEQIIEETYANSLGGRRTLETTTPRGGKDSNEVDINLARTNTEYFKEVMANPVLKAKYNKSIESRLNL